MLLGTNKKEAFETCHRNDEACRDIGKKYIDFHHLDCVREYPELVQRLSNTEGDAKDIINSFDKGFASSPFGVSYVLYYDVKGVDQERHGAGQIYYYALEKLRLSKHWFEYQEQLANATTKVDAHYYQRLIEDNYQTILRLLSGERDGFLYNNLPYDAIVYSGNHLDQAKLEKAKKKINRYFNNEQAHSVILNGYFRLEYSSLFAQNLSPIRKLARKLMESATTKLLEDVQKLFDAFANSKNHLDEVLQAGLEQQRQEYESKLKAAQESHAKQLIDMHETINRLQDMVDKNYQQNELLLDVQKQQSRNYENQLLDLLEKLKHES